VTSLYKNDYKIRLYEYSPYFFNIITRNVTWAETTEHKELFYISIAITKFVRLCVRVREICMKMKFSFHIGINDANGAALRIDLV
jgi:hypothetical protein